MRFSSLQCKDVINVNDGSKLGYVNDVEMDDACLCITCLVICRSSLMDYIKFFHGNQEMVLSMSKVVSIGEDVILVNI